MTAVTVEAPPKPPKLSGDYQSDIQALYDYMSAMSRVVTALRVRTGGSTDSVNATAAVANTAAATASASQAGATIPTDGGAITLTPSDPLGYHIVDTLTATIRVLSHTRTGAGATLLAGSVSPDVDRDNTYYVYYSDAGDVGGAQTYLASDNLAVVTGTAGYRIIGTIFIPPAFYP